MTDLKKLAEVKRYDCGTNGYQYCSGCFQMNEDDLGEYIRYSDYTTLLQEVETLRSERDLAVAKARQEALALAENICRAHAREYGAINESVTNEHRRLDYASERALLTAADAISALQQPTVEDGETKP